MHAGNRVQQPKVSFFRPFRQGLFVAEIGNSPLKLAGVPSLPPWCLVRSEHLLVWVLEMEHPSPPAYMGRVSLSHLPKHSW